MSVTSPHCPWPPAPISTLQTVACDSSWWSGGGGDGDGHPCPHLPLVVMVIAHLEVLGHCLCCCGGWWLDGGKLGSELENHQLSVSAVTWREQKW